MISETASSVVHNQGFPRKPIHLVTVEVGGGPDLITRIIAQGISEPLGQPIIVDNHGTSGIGLVAKAAPDGYTLLVLGPPLWTVPLLRETPYDPIKDFTPITLATTSPLIVVVHPSVAANSTQELIALAQARPGELSYASGPTGSSSHLAAELFKSTAGIDIVHIPYKSGGQAVADLLAGKVQLMIPSAGTAMPHIKAGRLRALGVASAEPSALTSGIPAVAASGLPGYEATQMIGIFAPAKTPLTVVKRLNQEIVRFLKTAEAKARLLDAGVEAVGSTPEELAARIKSEMTRLGKVIKDAGIRV